MDDLLILLLFLGVIVPISAILGVIAFVRLIGVRRRLAKVEHDLAFALARLRLVDDASVAQGLIPPIGVPAPPPVPPSAAERYDAWRPTGEPAPDLPVTPAPVPESLPEAAPGAGTVLAARVPDVAVPPEPPAPRDIESMLGTRWAVWVGGLALALGGIFLVRTSIEQGWLGPEARIVLGALLGLALTLAGEGLRRRGMVAPLAGLRHADIPSILVAAGTSTLFAAIFAAHALYDFIGPAAAFTGLAAVALGTVLLALLHAPWLAGLGLLGGYVAPLLVTSDTPSAWPVVGLLALLTGTAVALARFKGWTPIGWLGWVATAAWTALLLVTGAEAGAIGTHILATLGIGVAEGALRTRFATVPNEPSTADRRLAVILCGLAALAAAVFVGSWGASATPLFVAALTAALLLASAVVSDALRWNAVIAAVLAALTVAAFDVIVPAVAFGQIADPRTLGIVPDRSVDTVIWTAAGFAALFGLGGLWGVIRTGDARLGAAGALTPVAVLAIAYLRFRLLGAETGFGVAALALAAVLAATAEWLVRRDPDGASALWGAAGLYGAGSAAALGIALGLLTPSGGLPLGFALAAVGIAAVHGARPLPMLRWAAAGAAIVAALLLMRDDLGALFPDPAATWPIVNSLLTAVALPALAVGGAAWLLRRRAGDHPATLILEGIAGSLTLLWLWLTVGDTIGRIDGAGPTAAAVFGPRAALLLASAAGFGRLAARTGSAVYGIARQVAYAFAALAALGAVLLHPYLLGGTATGGVLVNDLLLAYLLPGVVAAVVALRERRRDATHVLAAGTEVAAHVLLIAYVLGQVGVLFRGTDLVGRMSPGEFWAYSAVGLGYGIVLLGLGLVLQRRTLRMASAAVLVVTVAKVFLLDMAGLTGFWRALSFIGLGAVLVAIGLVYQRLLARQPLAPAAEGNSDRIAPS